MLGAGVLGLPHAVKGMGLYTSIILLAIITGMSVYGGLLLGWIRDTRPIRTYSDLALHCGNKISPRVGIWSRFLVTVVAYSYIIGSCTIYLTTMKICLMEMIQKCEDISTLGAICDQPACSTQGVANLSSTVWLLISMLCVFPLIHFRSLSDASIVSYFGVLTIAIVNVIIVVRCIIVDTDNSAPKAVEPYERSFRDVINGMTSLAFAYGGHVVMPDIQSEMRSPQDFSKSIFLSQFFMLINYSVVGFLGFLTYGDLVGAPITQNLPDDAVRIFTNACLLLHVMVAYCIMSTVVTRALCDAWWPGMVTGTSLRRRRPALRWGMVSSAILVGCGLMALLVPFFSDLMNIWSSMGVFTLSFGVPPAFYLMTNRGELSTLAIAVNGIIIVLAAGGAGLGVWAAVADIVDKWQHCNFSLSF